MTSVPAPAEPRSAGVWRAVEGATLATLLALASTFLAGTPGYRFGDSNHGITIPILKRLMVPELYPGDVMVATAERFPTIFYRALAAVLPRMEAIPTAFFVLYVVSIAATLAGAYRIGRWFGGRPAGVLCLLMAFPVRIGLAGEALYRVAFSHSHLASALTIWAIVWFLEGRRLLPLLVLSLGAYNHLLYSAYMLVPMTLVVLWEARQVPRRATITRLAVAVLPLVPLAAWSLAHSAPMTPEWLTLLRLRSSHHSFPSFFGADLPEAAALLALAALGAARLDSQRRRMLAAFLAGTAVLFVVGSALTELWPVKAVLQLQPHRAWRFLMLVLRGAAAVGVLDAWRGGGASRVAAVVAGAALIVPGLEPLGPLALVSLAFFARPLPPAWARLTAAVVLVIVTGWNDRAPAWTFVGEMLPRVAQPNVLAAAAIVIALVAVSEHGARARRAAVVLAAAATLLWVGPRAYADHRARWESGPWRAAQDWVRRNTPRDAVLLTPPKEAGFRVFSERTIVAEWKDGTQQYFDDGFVREWGARMEALGDDFTVLPDAAILGLARRYGASYVVLPRLPRRGLVLVYRNPSWAVYRAEPESPRASP